MKKFDSKLYVNEDEQLQIIKNHVHNNWNGDSKIIDFIIEQAFNLGLKTQSLKSLDILNYTTQKSKIRKKQLDKSSYIFDSIYNIFDLATGNIEKYNSIQEPNYYDSIQYLKKLKLDKQILKKIKPKNWNEIKCFEDLEKFDSYEQQNKFEGYSIQSAVDGNFETRISLERIYYAEKEQNQPAFENLFGSIWYYATQLKINNNTHQLLKSFDEFLNYFNNFEDEKFKKPLYIKDLTSIFNNPIANSLMAENSNQKSFYQSQKELDSYTKKVLGLENEYGICSFNLNNKIKFVFITKIFSEEHFQEKINEKIKDYFLNNKNFEIGLNDEKFLLSESDLLSNISFEKIDKNQFKTLSLLFPNDKNKIKIGNEIFLIDYSYPTKEEIVDFKNKSAEKLKNEMQKLFEFNFKNLNDDDILNEKNKDDDLNNKIKTILNTPTILDNFKKISFDIEKSIDKYYLATFEFEGIKSHFISKSNNITSLKKTISNTLLSINNDSEKLEISNNLNTYQISLSNEEILKKIKFKEISEEDFLIIKKINNSNNEKILIGDSLQFFQKQLTNSIKLKS